MSEIDTIEHKNKEIESLRLQISSLKAENEQLKSRDLIHEVMNDALKAVIELRDRNKLCEEICRIADEKKLFDCIFTAVKEEKSNLFYLCGFKSSFEVNTDNFRPELDDIRGFCFSSSRGHYDSANIILRENITRSFERFFDDNGFKKGVVYPVMLYGNCIGIIGACDLSDEAFLPEKLELLGRLSEIAAYSAEFYMNEDIRDKTVNDYYDTAERFKLFAEQSGLLLYDSDKINNISSFIIPIAGTVGYDTAEFKNLDYQDFYRRIHPDDKPRIDETVKLCSAENPRYSVTYRYLSPNGTVVWFEDSGAYQYDSEGMIIKQTGLLKDIGNRVSIVNQLIENEQMLRTLINSTPDIICFKDGKGRWLTANDADLELFGLKGVDYVGKTDAELADFADPLYREAFLNCEQTDKLTWEKGVLSHAEEAIPVSETEYKIYDVIKVPLFHEDGTGKALVVLGREMTERKKAEAELEKNSEFLNLIIESLPIGLFVRDVKNSFRYSVWNSKMVDIFGITKDTALNKNDFELGFPVTAELFRNSDIELFEKDYLLDFPYQVVQGDGKTAEFRTIKVPIRDKDGNPESVLGLVEDIGARIKIEKTRDLVYLIAQASILTKDLHEFYDFIRAELSEILDTDNFIIALYNKENHTLSLQYMQDEKDHFDVFPAGKTLSELVIKNKESLLLKTGDIKKLQEQGIIDAVGSLSSCWLGVPLMLSDEAVGLIVVQSYTDENAYNDEHRRFLEFISTQIAASITKKRSEEALEAVNRELEERVLDRTKKLEDAMIELRYENDERRRTQEELYAAQEELNSALQKEIELNELKNRFIQMVSHEYRTPLTVILSSTYLLSAAFNTTDEETFTKYLYLIQDSVAEMTRLLEDVLFMGKAYSGKLDDGAEECDLNHLLQSAIEEIKTADKGNHIITLNCRSGKLFPTKDEKLIRRIAVNLLSNAVKYSPEKSEIIVETVREGGIIKFSVEDKGIGIPDEEKALMFEPFHRFNNVGTTQGTGLGLAIIKNCADTIGAEIKLKSKINEGTKFEILLPD